jgi:hypothetical protein
MKLTQTMVDQGSLEGLAAFLRKQQAAITAGWNTEHLSDGTHRYPSPRILTATVAHVSNSTAETPVIRFPMAASAMANGDIVTITAACTTKNGSGAARTPTLRVRWGAATGTPATQAWSNGNVDNKNLMQVWMQRVDAELWVREYHSTTIPMDQVHGYDLGAAVANSQFVEVITGIDFAADAVVQITVTLDAASAAYYWKFHAARVLTIGS